MFPDRAGVCIGKACGYFYDAGQREGTYPGFKRPEKGECPTKR
jgi:hypothetical protein